MKDIFTIVVAVSILSKVALHYIQPKWMASKAKAFLKHKVYLQLAYGLLMVWAGLHVFEMAAADVGTVLFFLFCLMGFHLMHYKCTDKFALDFVKERPKWTVIFWVALAAWLLWSVL